ncbi:MAG TPA: amidohydrolase family protein [Tepidisphaeraceae bacterium]
MNSTKTLIQADSLLLPRGLQRDASVVFTSGKILETGPTRDVTARHPDAQIVDRRDSILLPGLVNAHTHLELSNCSCEPRSENFTDWIVSLVDRIGPERDFDAATRKGISECLRFGVTSVGDISQQMDTTRPILAKSPLRVVSYGEALGLSRIRGNFDRLFNRAIDKTFEAPRFTTALTPHAPYTVDLPSYQRALAAAKQLNLPLATHLSELPDEEQFLRHQTGPLRDLYEKIRTWDHPVETYPASSINFAHAIGLLDYPTLLAHVNYCTDEELALLAKGNASVVYCPRTHQYFNHPPHRFRDMLEKGINVALGTDSCASSPDLNLLDDLRLVHHLHPDLPAQTLFQLVTTNAAKALRCEHEVGALRPNYWADIIALPSTGPDPLLSILEADLLPTKVWTAGNPT